MAGRLKLYRELFVAIGILFPLRFRTGATDRCPGTARSVASGGMSCAVHRRPNRAERRLGAVESFQESCQVTHLDAFREWLLHDGRSTGGGSIAIRGKQDAYPTESFLFVQVRFDFFLGRLCGRATVLGDLDARSPQNRV